MNILHVIDWAGLGGGAETVAFDVANSLPYNNYVYYFRRLQSFNSREFGELKNIKLIKSGKDCTFFNLYPNVAELKGIIEKYNINIVHGQLFWSNLAVRLATPRSLKLFTTIHNIQSKSSLRSRHMQLIERLTYRDDEVTFCVSEEVNRDYKAIVPQANTATLYNFINDKFFNNRALGIKRNDNRIKFIAVGTVKPQKNYAFLLNVFLELKNRGRTEISLDVYGKGELISKFRNQVKESGINVDFKGEELNLDRIYPEYDAFIMASLYEGYGLSILEAFASRLPVFVSDISVIREVTNSNGIFFNPECIEDCVEKILNFCDHKYDTTQIIETGYSWAQKVAQKSVHINKLLEFYNKQDPAQSPRLNKKNAVLLLLLIAGGLKGLAACIHEALFLAL